MTDPARHYVADVALRLGNEVRRNWFEFNFFGDRKGAHSFIDRITVDGAYDVGSFESDVYELKSHRFRRVSAMTQTWDARSQRLQAFLAPAPRDAQPLRRMLQEITAASVESTKSLQAYEQQAAQELARLKRHVKPAAHPFKVTQLKGAALTQYLAECRKGLPGEVIEKHLSPAFHQAHRHAITNANKLIAACTEIGGAAFAATPQKPIAATAMQTSARKVAIKRTFLAILSNLPRFTSTASLLVLIGVPVVLVYAMSARTTQLQA